MTWQRDLAPCTYFYGSGPELSTRLIAVGWLHRFEPYTHGSVSRAQRAKLGELLEDPWNPFTFLGYHLCECGKSRPGVGNLFVPSAHGLFASPELIDHYIDVHDYRPPDEFLEAVEACPPMRSPEYLAQIEAHLGERFPELSRVDQETREMRAAAEALALKSLAAASARAEKASEQLESLYLPP